MARDAVTIGALSADLKQRIRYARDVVRNDRIYVEILELLQRNFEDAKKKLEAFEDLRTNGERYIDEWKQQLVSLQQELAAEQNADTISKLKKTLEQINELS